MLSHLLGASRDEVVSYLQEESVFYVQGIITTPPVKDYTHLLIRFEESDETIEWAFLDQTTPAEKVVQQQETRTCTRFWLSKLFKATTIAAGNARKLRNTEIYRGDTKMPYIPYHNDCFTYVDDVLKLAGMDPHKLHHRLRKTAETDLTDAGTQSLRSTLASEEKPGWVARAWRWINGGGSGYEKY